MKGATIAAGDVAAAEPAAELNLDAKEPTSQCLPAGRGTTVVTNDRDGVAIAASDAAAVIAAAELDLEADGAQTAVLASRQRHRSRHQ